MQYAIHLYCSWTGFWDLLDSNRFQDLSFCCIVSAFVHYLHFKGLSFTVMDIYTMFPEDTIFSFFVEVFLVRTSPCVGVLPGLSIIFITAVSITFNLVCHAAVSTASWLFSRAHKAVFSICTSFLFERIVLLEQSDNFCSTFFYYFDLDFLLLYF